MPCFGNEAQINLISLWRPHCGHNVAATVAATRSSHFLLALAYQGLA